MAYCQKSPNLDKNLYVCLYLGSISSFAHISLNNIDLFCLHIFIYLVSSCRIDFIVFGVNWLMKLP